MDRTSGRARGPMPGISRGQGRGDSAVGPRRGNRQDNRRGAPPPGKPRGDRVWGHRPKYELDQAGLSILFSEQVRFKTALSRQARLAKLDVAEVRSTEAEQLRWINSQIAAGFTSVTNGSNPFERSGITDAQMKSEEMIRRQGVRSLGSPMKPQPNPVVRAPLNRRRTNVVVPTEPMGTTPPSELFVLTGPLAREFSRAKGRGYWGPPNRWLRGPAAARLITKLHHRGVIDPLWTGRLSVFDRRSPLRYAISGCTASPKMHVRRGFYDERLHNDGANVARIVGQARAVARLPLKQWPRDLSGGHAWPTFPTLYESWEMLGRRKPPLPIYDICDSRKFSKHKLPTSRVLPGMMARTISSNVRGIRADVPVPAELLAYFKYRWGFLILQQDRPLPVTLQRFLCNVWKTGITKMFLVCPIRYNDALRRMPDNRRIRLSGWVSGSGPPAKGKGPRSPKRRLRRLKVPTTEISESDTTASDKSGGGLRLF